MMYYLKCAHCGYENLLRTEYLTFCEQCGKKLPVNFPEWSRLHPGKTFEDFKKEATQPGLPLKTGIRVKKPSVKIISATIILLLIVCISWLYFSNGGDFKGLFLPDKTAAAVLKQNWERHTYGRFGLSLESPVKLEKMEVRIPEAYKQRLKESEAYYYRPSKGFQVMISTNLFDEGTRIQLDGAMAGAINELINQPGVSNMEFRQSPLLYNDVRGLLLDGTYHKNGDFMRFQCAVYNRRSIIWSVWVTYKDADKNGKKAAERVMNSVEINYYVKTM